MGVLTFFLSVLSVLYYVEGSNTTVSVGEHWWGPDELRGYNDTAIRQFRVTFNKDMIHDLRRRLSYYRPPKPTFRNVGFEYGFNSQEVSGWIDYWANVYPFKEREGFLNIYPQFTTLIQGLYIHFIRVIPKVPPGVRIIPMLLLHGWPGSVREFYENIPYLTAVSPDRNFAIEVIAPSLPGFGFSDAAVCPGLNSANIAVVMRNLMRRLGHYKFCVQGGDWGGIIGADLSVLFPKEVIGFHTNAALSFAFQGLLLTGVGALYPPLVVKPALAERMYPVTKQFLFLLREFGYFHMQATKPDTLGVALSDSPAGLLAHVFQIFSTGTNRNRIPLEDGGLSHYPRATLVDNLMMYWASNSITSSLRIYAESFNKQFSFSGTYFKPTKVPTWALQARWEVTYQSPIVLRTKFKNLLNATVFDDGGHFLALEMPKPFAEDVLTAVREFIKWQSKNRV